MYIKQTYSIILCKHSQLPDHCIFIYFFTNLNNYLMYCSTPGYGSATGLHLGELTNCLKGEKIKKIKNEKGLEEHCENKIRLFSHKSVALVVKWHLFFFSVPRIFTYSSSTWNILLIHETTSVRFAFLLAYTRTNQGNSAERNQVTLVCNWRKKGGPKLFITYNLDNL